MHHANLEDSFDNSWHCVFIFLPSVISERNTPKYTAATISLAVILISLPILWKKMGWKNEVAAGSAWNANVSVEGLLEVSYRPTPKISVRLI